MMMGDLKQIRRFSLLLQKTEIKFDLLSAVDELATQVKLEFEFRREAKVMDTIADNLKVCLPFLFFYPYLACFPLDDLLDFIHSLARHGWC